MTDCEEQAYGKKLRNGIFQSKIRMQIQNKR